jgi:hypothetical protein
MEPLQGNIYHTGGGNQMETELVRIAKMAREKPKERFTTLIHHINQESLMDAIRKSVDVKQAG